MRLAHPILALLVLLVIAGCSRSQHAHRDRGVSLSEVSREAGEPGGRVERGGGRSAVPQGGHVHHDHSHEPHGGHHAPGGHHSPAHGAHAGAVTTAGAASAGSVDGAVAFVSHYGLQVYEGGQPVDHRHRFQLAGLAVRDGHLALELGIGFGVADIDREQELAAGIEDPFDLWFGGAVRGHLFAADRHDGLDPYLGAGFRVAQWFWQYRNPVLVDGESIDNDSITAWDFSLDLGLRAHFGHLVLDAAFDPGVTVFDGQTREGFRNDVFEDAWYWGARAGLGYSF